jgi:phage tail protein X
MDTFLTTTLDGDTVDQICWRELGTTSGGVVETTYRLNRGFADYGPTLPGDIDIVLPVIANNAPSIIAMVNLWD